jgi:hypothetical protein
MRRHRSLFGPLLLIFIGVIFLLNNLGLIQWSIWDVILRFWPVLLIAAGLDLILGQRSAWGSALAMILILAIIGGGIVLIGDPNPSNAAAEEVSIPGDGAKQVSLLLDPAIGYIRLSPGHQSQSDLLQGRLSAGRGEQIEQRQAGSGSRPEIVIRTRSWTMLPFLITSFERPAWDLELKPGTEVDLVVDLGLGKAEVDLRQLLPEEARVDVGLGEAWVALPEHGGEVTVDVGIGQLTIELPATVGVHIRADTGIGTTVIPPDFVRRDGGYYSPGYEQAVEKIELKLNIGIGTLIVR